MCWQMANNNTSEFISIHSNWEKVIQPNVSENHLKDNNWFLKNRWKAPTLKHQVDLNDVVNTRDLPLTNFGLTGNCCKVCPCVFLCLFVPGPIYLSDCITRLLSRCWGASTQPTISNRPGILYRSTCTVSGATHSYLFSSFSRLHTFSLSLLFTRQLLCDLCRLS